MLILLRLDPTDGRAMRAYRLQVKERLYRFNFVSVPCFYAFYPHASLVGNIGAAGKARATGQAGRNIPECAGRLHENISITQPLICLSEAVIYCLVLLKIAYTTRIAFLLPQE